MSYQWNFEVVTKDYFPRQFEYHPNSQHIVFGTIHGECYTIDMQTRNITELGFFGSNNRDSILALCWLKQYPNYIVSGSGTGKIHCMKAFDEYGEGKDDNFSVARYQDFAHLTSLHINMDDSLLLTSGYSRGIRVYDAVTGSILREMESLHDDHINISRFSNQSPNLLTTSSFDKTLKTWDLRTSMRSPIYSVKCNTGIVMINFSKDDNFILASALDNEINQIYFMDGRHHLTYQIPSTGLTNNFTRAYYSSSGKYAISGACEEKNVKILSPYSGEYLASVDMFPGKKDKSLYIQSLRGNPINDEEFCVLTNYRDLPYRELVVVSRELTCPDFHDVESYEPLTTVFSRQQDSIIDNENIAFQRINKPEEVIHSSCAIKMNSREYLSTLLTLRTQSYSAELSFPIITDEVKENFIYLRHNNISNIDQNPHFHSSDSFPFSKDIEDSIYYVFYRQNYAIHTSVILTRCPVLYSIYSQQYPIIDASVALQMRNVLDLSSLVPQNLWYLMNLMIDYWYISSESFSYFTLKHLCLLKLISFHDKTTIEQIFYSLYQERGLKLPLQFDESQLVIICEDITLWKTNPILSQLMIETVFDLRRLANIFDQSSLINSIDILIIDILSISNFYSIVNFAFSERLQHILDSCLYFSLPVIESLTYPPLGLSLSAFIDNESPENILLMKTAPIPEEWKVFLKMVSDSRDAYSVEVVDRETMIHRRPDTVDISKEMKEEIYYLRKTSESPASFQLPKFACHTACVMQDKTILFLGGSNKDRIHTLSKILTYDVKKQLFRFVNCTGTNTPYSASIHCSYPIQKHNARHLVIIGSRVKDNDPLKKDYTFQNIFTRLMYPNYRDKSIKSQNSSKSNRSGSLCFVYELDYELLNWKRIGVDVVVTPLINSTAFIPNTPSIQEEDVEDELENLVFNLNDNQGTDNTQEKISLADSYLFRSFQTVCTFYQEDIPYRCKYCLFRGRGTCTRCSEGSSLNTPDDLSSQFYRSWGIQFGGFCSQRENLSRDLHALISTQSVVDKTKISYEWVRLYSIGPKPHSRYYHASAAVPASQNNQGAEIYARMFVFGGITHGEICDDLHSLRINTTSRDHGNRYCDVEWEHIRVNGSPGRRHSHSLVHLPAENICLSFGGYRDSSKRQANNEIWALTWLSLSDHSMNTTDFSLVCTWTRISVEGIKPSPRGNHSCSYVNMDRGVNQGSIFVFGGCDEQKIGVENSLADSVIHALQWKIPENQESQLNILYRSNFQWISPKSHDKLLLVNKEQFIPRVSDNISINWMHLLHIAPKFYEHIVFQPDIKFIYEGSDKSISAHSSILMIRSTYFSTILTCSMIEAQTRIIEVPVDILPLHWYLFLQFLYSDCISFDSIEEVLGLLDISKRYNVPSLTIKCESVLTSLVSMENIIDLLQYSDWYDFEVLRMICYGFLLRLPELKSLLEEDICEFEPSESEIDDVSIEENTSKSILELFKNISKEIKMKFRNFVLKTPHAYKYSIEPIDSNDLASSS